MQHISRTDRLENLLDGKMTKSDKEEILDLFRSFTQKQEELYDRVHWLESIIDEADMEEKFVEYQKKFSVKGWVISN